MTISGSGSRGGRYLVAEAVEAFDCASAGALDAAFGDLDGTGVEVGLAGLEDTVGGDEDLVSDCDDGPSVTAPPAELHVVLAEVGALGAWGSAGGLRQGCPQPLRTLAGLPR